MKIIKTANKVDKVIYSSDVNLQYQHSNIKYIRYNKHFDSFYYFVSFLNIIVLNKILLQ